MEDERATRHAPRGRRGPGSRGRGRNWRHGRVIRRFAGADDVFSGRSGGSRPRRYRPKKAPKMSEEGKPALWTPPNGHGDANFPHGHAQEQNGGRRIREVGPRGPRHAWRGRGRGRGSRKNGRGRRGRKAGGVTNRSTNWSEDEYDSSP
eukprot:1329642-Amorphochlora_amoeboformis.AAC.1